MLYFDLLIELYYCFKKGYQVSPNKELFLGVVVSLNVVQLPVSLHLYTLYVHMYILISLAC